MILYQPPEPSPPIPCPYLPERELTYEQFFAGEVQPRELDWLLARGWRKFGNFFFRPACQGCRDCHPLRLRVTDFQPSKSQRRVLRKGAHIRFELGPLRYRPEYFDLYARHSQVRLRQPADLEDFLVHLHTPSCPTLLGHYYLEDKLVGLSYLDIGETSLSSVYFVFDPDVANLSLGILSILREISLAHRLGRGYYYLGFAVPGCSRMAYKERFRPFQTYCWETHTWQTLPKP